MNHSSRNDDFWLSLEGYARAYYRVLHEKYGLPPFVGGKKFTLHANKTLQPRFFSTDYLDRIGHCSVTVFFTNFQAKSE